MLVILATVPIDPDSHDEAVAAAADLAEASRTEDGVIDYRVGTDVEDGSTLRFVERYEDEAALAAHGETDHFQAFQGEIAGLLGGVPEMERIEVESISEMEL